MRAALVRQREALKAAQEGFQALLQGIASGESRLTVAEGVQEALVLGALRDAWAVGIVDLERLLNQRADSPFARMWLHLGTALVLLGCILSLVTLVARQIAKPLQQLARVADEVRKERRPQRCARSGTAATKSAALVAAFNEMLSQLDRDRVLQQELAASARAAEAQRELVEAFPSPWWSLSIPEHEVLHSNAPAAQWLGGRKTDPWAAWAGARRARASSSAWRPGLGR